jgi:hypothetical protein
VVVELTGGDGLHIEEQKMPIESVATKPCAAAQQHYRVAANGDGRADVDRSATHKRRHARAPGSPALPHVQRHSR